MRIESGSFAGPYVLLMISVPLPWTTVFGHVSRLVTAVVSLLTLRCGAAERISRKVDVHFQEI